MTTIRLTAAQAMVRYLANQKTEIDGVIVPIFAGVWGIFGHGNVAGLGEALYGIRDELPTFRGHNEQTMTHAGIAFAKAHNRRRMMAATTSIGPGALNMVTAAALAHVNRLPILLIPGDVFANRAPDPVLQQIEAPYDATVSANDCFRPVSRYFDRLTRPEQLLAALPRAMAVLTDPVECGPVTLAFCQDVQAEAYDYPSRFFAERVWTPRRPRPDTQEVMAAVAAIKAARNPIVIAGGGVLYSGATGALRAFIEATGIPLAETQAGKSSLPWDHPLNLGSIGVTGSAAANSVAEAADLVIAVGTRLQDFTTGSWALFKNPHRRLLALNVAAFDAHKHDALPLVSDAREGLQELSAALGNWASPAPSTAAIRDEWIKATDAALAAPESNALPSDAQVLGAIQRAIPDDTLVVCAAGGLPGELHKLWRASTPNSYHVEYGFSCMGYEVAAGLGAKLAYPEREVIVTVGDGSYLMANSELATAVAMGLKIIVVILNNQGYGCINRLQRATGGAGFNNLWQDTHHVVMPSVDFTAHAASLGAVSEKVGTIADLEAALARAHASPVTYAVVIDTDPLESTAAGGHWWDVAVPAVSDRPHVEAARATYETNLAARQATLS